MAGKRMRADAPDAENPEWTAEELANARPMAEVFPELVRKPRGPNKAPTKVPVTIRLSRDVVSRFRESGTGWQTRMDDALKSWLERHNP